ncbi:unnamed protein product, partial [Candidula unifasciata]
RGEKRGENQSYLWSCDLNYYFSSNLLQYKLQAVAASSLLRLCEMAIFSNGFLRNLGFYVIFLQGFRGKRVKSHKYTYQKKACRLCLT